MTTLAELNALRVENGKTELKSWKQSKDKLEAAIVAEMEDRAKRLADCEEGINPEDLPVSDVMDLSVRSADLPNEGITVEPSDLSDVDEGVLSVEEATRLLTPIPRGAIGALSIELLTASDEPYADIVAKIKAIYPAAMTTPRSLASVAMDLRRDGIEVPSRRKPAKVKTDEAAS